MDVASIVSQVKWCIDHETKGYSQLLDNGEDTYMDNIIKAKISDALNWLVASAPSQSIIMPSASDDTLIKDYDTSKTTDGANGLQYNKGWNNDNGIGMITFPSDDPLRLLRLRGVDWHKGIINPYEEDSDEALFMYDYTAKGTVDKPLAVILRGNPTRLLVQPASESFELTFARHFSLDIAAGEDVPVPKSVQSAFIYYIAYLLLSAYGDANANLMLQIAVQMLGVKQ